MVYQRNLYCIVWSAGEPIGSCVGSNREGRCHARTLREHYRQYYSRRQEYHMTTSHTNALQTI